MTTFWIIVLLLGTFVGAFCNKWGMMLIGQWLFNKHKDKVADKIVDKITKKGK
jgi:hypothetical protein